MGDPESPRKQYFERKGQFHQMCLEGQIPVTFIYLFIYFTETDKSFKIGMELTKQDPEQPKKF